MATDNYSGFERKIAFLLSKFPSVKLTIKKIYQRLNYLKYKKNYNIKSDYQIKKINTGDGESFFGYYDKSPINITNEYIIFQTVSFSTTNMPNKSKSIDLVLFDIQTKSYEVIDKLFAYNWQQGSKLMWIDDFKFIYNNYDEKNDRYISKIYDLKMKQFKTIDYPIYDAYKNKVAIGLNFDRLNIGRADYSYSNRNVNIDWLKNDNDGLFYIDLENNTIEMIISIEDIISFNQKETMKNAKHKFNHIMISPNGTKVMFMHRWFTENNRRFDTLIVCDIDGKNIKIVADDDMVSHCYWYDNENIFAYLRDKEMGDKFYMINIENPEKKIVGKGIIDKFGDGHPTIHKNKIVFDTYPNKARMLDLFLFDIDTNELKHLGEFFQSFDFYGETRCDLHPRFSFDGKKIFFDSVHEGKRQLYMMDIEK